MKKILITIVLAIGVGSGFAYFMFKNIEQGIAKTTEDYNVTAFQVGVFSNYENALKASKNYKSYIIYQDENYYRIFIAMFHDEQIISLMQEYYQDQTFYLKQLKVSEEFLTKLAKYESLIKESSITNYDEVNQSILNEFERN